MSTLILNRRRLLWGAGAVLGTAAMPGWQRIAFAAAPGDRRFVVVILRGALDGMAALAPIGDPAYAGLRGELALTLDGPKPALKLNGMFALHPDLANFKRLFDKGELSAFHAVANPIEERSHFEAQAILETGIAQRGGLDGWLNRALKAMGEGDAAKSMAFSESMPMILRGAAPATTYMPSDMQAGSADFMSRVTALYAADPVLAPALAKGLEVQAVAAMAVHSGDDAKIAARVQRQNNLEPLAETAGRLLARADGPRVAVLEAGGWDTHVNQGAADGQLARRLANLDASMAALAAALGDAWSKTVVAVITEFGRTARPNGNKGTDHGTGTVAFLLGGAVKGGQVVADWPGLADGKLFENRDLAATRDIRSILKGAVSGHLGIAPDIVDREVFPDSGSAPAIEGILRA